MFGRQIRPTPPHLTSAIAENILAAACDSESRNAAKRMRLDTYPAAVNVAETSTNSQVLVNNEPTESFFFFFFPGQDEPAAVDKSSLREPVSVAPSGFSISGPAFAQEQLYTNGGLNYSLRGYTTVAGNQNSGAAQTNGEQLSPYLRWSFRRPRAVFHPRIREFSAGKPTKSQLSFSPQAPQT